MKSIMVYQKEKLMRMLLMIIFLITGSATLSCAQTPDDQPKNQFFAGYSFNSADINTLTIDPRRTGQNGINLEYTRQITRDIGITGDASAHFHREPVLQKKPFVGELKAPE